MSAGGEGDQQGLGQPLPDQRKAAGPDRETNRDLLLPRRRTGQQQAGEVRAGDQKHQADHRQQDAQRRAPELAQQIDPLRGGPQFDTSAGRTPGGCAGSSS